MTEERKVAKKQRVDDADDAVDAAVLSAMEQVQKRLDQLSLKRQGARPAIQNMIATDMWIKVKGETPFQTPCRRRERSCGYLLILRGFHVFL